MESAVNDRMAQYQAYIEEIGEYYEECGQHINADQDIHTVFECIESIIVNPIPRKNWNQSLLCKKTSFTNKVVHNSLVITRDKCFKTLYYRHVY